jgi:hypothetical protein
MNKCPQWTYSQAAHNQQKEPLAPGNYWPAALISDSGFDVFYAAVESLG